VAILSHVAVEEGPSAVTAFVHVVALHQVLCGEFGSILTIFQFHARLDDLGERNCVAGTTSALVSNRVSKVISIEISVVVLVWDLFVWNFVCSLIFFAPGLCLKQCILEIIGLFCKLFLFCFGLLF